MEYKDYFGAYDVLNQIKQDFSRNKRTIERRDYYEALDKNLDDPASGVILVRKTISDTVWKCKSAMLATSYSEFAILQNGKLETYWRNTGPDERRLAHPGTDYESTERPVIYGVVPAYQRHLAGYNGKGKCAEGPNCYNYKFQDSDDSIYTHYEGSTSEDFCSHRQNKCYERIYTKEFTVKQLSFWVLHIFPEVWYYPVDPWTGQPNKHDALKVDRRTMTQKRIAAMNSQQKTDWYWRKPYLSDSASVMFSISFMDAFPNETPLKNRDSISLRVFKDDETTVFQTFPSRMIRLNSTSGNIDKETQNALMNMYAQSPQQMAEALSLDTRCPRWKAIEEKNARELLEPVPGEPGALRLKRDGPPLSIFTYNKCPCERMRELNNFTPKQVHTLINQGIPNCSVTEMRKAKNVLQRSVRYLPALEDQLRIAELLKYYDQMIPVRSEQYSNDLKNDPEMIRKYESNCDPSWADLF